MIVVNCEQGSPEWFAARAGVITASMFSEVRKRVGGLNEQQQAYVDAIIAWKSEAEAKDVAGYKAAPKSDTIRRALAGEKVGDYTDAAKNYAFRLAIERITRTPLAEEQFETFAIRRGRELEPEAREAHAFAHDLLIERAGIVLTDDYKFGASADGLIAPDGGAEYKCLIAPDRIREIVLTRNIDEFLDQVQGCMWLTGRDWWHFCLYCPALASVGKALTVFPVQRDDTYIDAMTADLLAFDGLVTKYETELRKEAA